MTPHIARMTVEVDLHVFYPAFMKYAEDEETMDEFILRFAKTHYEILEAQEVVE